MPNRYILLLFIHFICISQEKFTSSNLPIVVINTHGQVIQDNPRIVCDMGIINNGFGNINSLNDSFNDYNGKISIEIRGSTSQSFPKKSYALETQHLNGDNNNISILGMPEENDWILYASYSDKSLMRNVLTFNLARKMGHYASRTMYCELVLNDEYQGIYVFMEKIKRDKNRVNISKLDSTSVSGDDLTGGYIVKIDKTTGSDFGSWLSEFPNLGGESLYIQHHYPESSEMPVEQVDYIKSYVDEFEHALDDLTGYSKYINVNSFVDFFIINELSRNADAYRNSTFLYKDKDSNGGKLTMGPFWDFNLAYGNINFCDGWEVNGWQQEGNCEDIKYSVFWFNRLIDDSSYQNLIKCRWAALRANILHENSISHIIDSVSILLNNAQERNFEKWDVLGTAIWPNYYVGKTYEQEVEFLKYWIFNRLSWMDSQIPDCGSLATIGPPVRELLYIIDILGRQIKEVYNVPLFYVYDNGDVEKKLILK